MLIEAEPNRNQLRADAQTEFADYGL